MQTQTPSRMHGGAFPHAPGCAHCRRENRCEFCGNSRGYAGKQGRAHGPGKCDVTSRESTVARWRVERARENRQWRIEGWLYERVLRTRGSRPRGLTCGFASLEELRAFAYHEATCAIGRDLNLVQRMQLELAVRDQFQALTLLCSVLEVQHA